MPIRGVDEARGETDEHQDGENFQHHHHVVRFGRFADPADENHGEQHDDDECRPVETEMPAGIVECVALQVAEARGEIGGRDPAQAGMDAKPVEQVDNVRGKSDADGHVGDGVLEDQIPADDPGDQFAHRGVGVRVGASGDGNHRGELRVAERGKAADNRDQHERKRDRRACAGAAEGRGVVDQVFEQGRVQNGFELEFLAGDGGADHGENAGADHGADAERSKAQPAESFLQALLGVLRVGDQLVNALGAEKLCAQSPPSLCQRKKLYLAPRFRATLMQARRLRQLEVRVAFQQASSRRNPES